MQQVISSQQLHLSRNNSSAKRFSLKTNAIANFFSWCDRQESNRYLWLGIALMGGIGTVVPVTLSAVVFIGSNSLALWVITLIFNVPVLVVNLAAQPAKITLLILFLAWIADAIIILYCLAGLL